MQLSFGCTVCYNRLRIAQQLCTYCSAGPVWRMEDRSPVLVQGRRGLAEGPGVHTEGLVAARWGTVWGRGTRACNWGAATTSCLPHHSLLQIIHTVYCKTETPEINDLNL